MHYLFQSLAKTTQHIKFYKHKYIIYKVKYLLHNRLANLFIFDVLQLGNAPIKTESKQTIN